MGGLARQRGECQGDDLSGHSLIERRDARSAGLVPKQPVDARLHEALLPAPDASLGFPVTRMISLVPTPCTEKNTICP